MGSDKPKATGADFYCLWVKEEPFRIAALSLESKDQNRTPEQNQKLAIQIFRETKGVQPYEKHPWGMLVEKVQPKDCIRTTFSRTSQTERRELGVFHSVMTHGPHECKLISEDGIIQLAQGVHTFPMRVSRFLKLEERCANSHPEETELIFAELKARFANSHICVREDSDAQ